MSLPLARAAAFMKAVIGDAAIAAGEGDQSGASDMTDLQRMDAPVMHMATIKGNMASVACRELLHPVRNRHRRATMT
jgi:hypothetical protein